MRKSRTHKSEHKNAKPERLHRRARERGVSPHAYALARLLVTIWVRVWFHARLSGAENLPAKGAAIITPNHKSFFDAFFVGVAAPRPVRFMAKTELMESPLGWLFIRLGAFPVRRGEADVEAMKTAQILLEQGELVVIFPEGTRVDDVDALGRPHHGAGRLALTTGAPTVPTAITGTHRLWLGPLPKPRRVQLAFLPAVAAEEIGEEPDAVAVLVDEHVWPAVRREYGRQLARPGLILTALAAIGLGAGALARRQARTQPRLLGVIESKKVRKQKARAKLFQHLKAMFRA